MSQQRLAWCLAEATLVCLVSPCRAASLRWTAPAECPTQATIEAQVERAIGRTLREVYGVDFEATIAQRNSREWALELRTQARTLAGETRTREVSGATCAEVSEAAVLAMTLAISERTAADSSSHEVVSTEPWEENAEPAAEPRPATAPSDPPGEDEPSDEASPPSAAEPVPLEFSAGVVALLDTALLPSLAPGVSLEFEHDDVQIDAALMAEGDELNGTLLSGNERINIRMMRTP